MALGKISICYRCGDAFELNKENMKLKRPHCGNHKPEEKSKNRDIEKFIGELFGGE